MDRIICILIGYGFGLFQTAYLIGKCRHIDIREAGSHNSGTTNALRVMGVKAGVATFIGDFLKALLAIMLVRFIFPDGDHKDLLAVYAGIGATLGHNYPFYMGFKGGKGIAVMAGIIAGLGGLFIPFPLVAFVVCVALTGYISLGSLLAALLLFVETIMYVSADIAHIETGGTGTEFCIAVALICAMAWWRHRSNIVRLMRGEENAVFRGRKS